MPPRKLAPLKAKARGRSKSSSPVALDDERPDAGGEGAGPASGQDVGLTTTPAKRKGKKNRERAPLLEGAGLAPDPDSAYVPPKLRRRDNMNGMSGNASPLARLARTGSGPVASRFHEVSTVDLCLEVEFDTLVQALSRRLSDWLAILPDDAIKDLADIAEVKHVQAGEAVFSQGQLEHSQELWVLVDGMVQGSVKPGLQEVPVLPPDLREESTRSSLGKKKSSKVKKNASKRGKQKEQVEQAKSDGAEEAINAIKAQNNAIVPVPLFATRTFGAVFGEDTLLSGDKLGYSLVAETDSKLCCISKEDYMTLSMLFFTDKQAMEKVNSYRRGAIDRIFASASEAGSLTAELFPEDLQTDLKDHAILRRFHAGQRIMTPSTKHPDAASAPHDAGKDAGEHAHAEGGQQDDQASAEQNPAPLLEQRPEPLLEEPSLFFLVSGQLDVIGFDEQESGHVACTSDAEGAIFGEFGVLMGDTYRRLAAVVATTDCQVCELPKEILAHRVAELSLRKDFRFKLKTQIADGDCKDVIRVAGLYGAAPNPLSSTSQRQGAQSHLIPQLKRLDSDTEDEDVNEEKNALLRNESPESELVRNATQGERDMAVAIAALDFAEKALFIAESQLKRAQESDDWAIFHKDVIDDIESAAALYSEVLVKHAKKMPLQGFDRLSLDRKLGRLDLMMLQVSAYMPPGKMQTERIARCKAIQQLLCSQKDFARLMHVRHHRVDWQSGSAVCNHVERCSERIKVLEDGVRRHREVLLQRYGERAGSSIHDQFFKWYQRKSAAWQRCHELVQQHSLFATNISNMEWQSRHRPLLEYEIYKLREMRVKSDEALRIAEKIRLDLLPLNRAVVHACFSAMPPPPAPAATSSPILAFLQYLQKIIELREDLRLAKGIATQYADIMMQRTFKDCSIGEVTEPVRKFSAEEAIQRRPDGSRDVAPVLQSFLTDLGSWLFAKDVERWAKQARKARKMGGASL